MARLRRSSAFNRAYAIALDWFFPQQCAGCQTVGEAWCDSCNNRVTRIEQPCSSCGFPMSESESDCPVCSRIPFAFDRARSWGLYEHELRRAILVLKHRKNAGLAEKLTVGLVNIYKLEKWNADLVVPIPLGVARKAERGFNQVDLIALAFTSMTGLALGKGSLERKRETSSQVGLNFAQRRENLLDAFFASPDLVTSKKVILLDDVMTTGATMDSAAFALKAAGASNVYGLSLGRAIMERDGVLVR
jgi:ComF family protein